METWPDYNLSNLNKFANSYPDPIITLILNLTLILALTLLFPLVATDGVHTLVEFGNPSVFVVQIDQKLVFPNSAKVYTR